MPTLHCEAWKDIPKWEGLYQASTLGRVKSVDRLDCRGYKRKGVILRPKQNRGGYWQVSLCDSPKRQMITVHRLVALTFLKGNFEGAVINHIDEDKDNNKADNLEFCTVDYNNVYSKSKHYTINHPCGKTDIIFNLRKFCREHNLHQSNMVQVAKGNPKHNQHKGFICREVL